MGRLAREREGGGKITLILRFFAAGRTHSTESAVATDPSAGIALWTVLVVVETRPLNLVGGRFGIVDGANREGLGEMDGHV